MQLETRGQPAKPSQQYTHPGPGLTDTRHGHSPGLPLAQRNFIFDMMLADLREYTSSTLFYRLG